MSATITPAAVYSYQCVSCQERSISHEKQVNVFGYIVCGKCAK